MEDRYIDFIIKAILTIIVFILIALFALLCQLGTQNRYDVNSDGIVNTSDYAELYKYIMENEAGANKYDVNGDGIVSASDYVEVKNYIMEEK